MLDLKDITKSYMVWGQEIQVLKGVTLRIENNSFVAIMGPSGSGKTTLMNIIGLLDTPTSGTYALDGRAVESLSGDEQSRFRGQKVGFIFQQYNLIPRISALDQVMLPLSYQGISLAERKERAQKALARVGLADKFASKPNELSGGQQQRVSIARAIVVNPAIILADEPTWALDSKTGEEVMQILASLHQEGKTIILITHDPDKSRFAQRIINIKDGMLEPEKIVIKHHTPQKVSNQKEYVS